MCMYPFAKKALTLHLARGEGRKRYYGCNLVQCKVLASSRQHLIAEAPSVPGRAALALRDDVLLLRLATQARRPLAGWPLGSRAVGARRVVLDVRRHVIEFPTEPPAVWKSPRMDLRPAGGATPMRCGIAEILSARTRRCFPGSSDGVMSKNTNELKTCAHDHAADPRIENGASMNPVRLLARPSIGGRQGSK